MKTDSRGFRYLVLFVTCMFVFGSYYSYDMPSVVMAQMEGSDIPPEGEEVEENIYHLTQDQYGFLYSIYSIFNFISVCFGGYFIDKFGFNICAMVFSGFLCLGQAVFSLGVTLNVYWVMVLGRAIFGLGGGNIGTCQNCVCSNYFKGKELSMSFSVCLAVSRLGSVLNFFTTSYLIDQTAANRNLPGIFWMGFGLCVCSLAFIVTFFFLDRKYVGDQLNVWNEEAKRLYPNDEFKVEITKDGKVKMIFNDKDTKVSSKESSVSYEETGKDENRDELDTKEKENLKDKKMDVDSDIIQSEEDKQLEELLRKYPLRKTSKAVKVKDIKTFGITYWFLDLLCGLFYPCLFVFIAICTDFINVKYPDQYDSHERSMITGIVYDVSLVVSPWFGIVVDKVGGKLWIQLAATLLLFPAFLLFLLTDIDPWWPVILLGISYSIMAAALWSSVPLIVPLSSVGTALSFMTAVQMLCNTIIQQIISALSPDTDDPNITPDSYDNVIYTFCGIAAATLVDIGVIAILDHRLGGWINKNDTTGKYNSDGTLNTNVKNKKKKGEKEALVRGSEESSSSYSGSSTKESLVTENIDE